MQRRDTAIPSDINALLNVPRIQPVYDEKVKERDLFASSRLAGRLAMVVGCGGEP